MKVCIIQPSYSTDYAKSMEYFNYELELLDKYNCRKYVYFMSGNDNVLKLAKELAPDICRCIGGGDAPYEMVERAIKYDCKKIQLVNGRFNQAMIDKAHQNGIICNIFWSDDVKETKAFLDMGIDTILTNDYNLISQAVNIKGKYQLTY